MQIIISRKYMCVVKAMTVNNDVSYVIAHTITTDTLKRYAI